MSFLWTYLEPNDARVRTKTTASFEQQTNLTGAQQALRTEQQQQQQQQHAQETTQSVNEYGPLTTKVRNLIKQDLPTRDHDTGSIFTSPRSRYQFSFFLAGAAFVVLSTAITRRALVRKHRAVLPKGQFSPSNDVNKVDGGVEAAEALFLATINVTSVAIMGVGGAAWAMDVSNLEDLRTIVRKRMNFEREVDAEGRPKKDDDTTSDEDMEEWVAVVMARLNGKSEGELAKMIAEAAEKGQSRQEVRDEIWKKS